MKVASFTFDGRDSYGVETENGIVEASPGFRAQYPDLRAVLTADALAELAVDAVGESIDVASIDYLPTIPNPDKIICIGINYRPHLEEMGRSPPDHPVMFVRFAGSQVGHEQAIVKSRADPDIAREIQRWLQQWHRQRQRPDPCWECDCRHCCVR